MFVSTPHNHVLALDARTGQLLWRYARELPEDQIQLHPTNRGVALWGDRVYMGTADAYLVALDARTGELVWEAEVASYEDGYYITSAPLVVRDRVLVGVSGGEFGIRGFVRAFEADSGESAWQTFTIPGPGEPGHDTWPAQSWATGGVPTWITGSYDPELNLIYWGTGNPGPWMGDQRPGDNLYSNSVLALDGATGELRGYHQYHWNGSWDWDEVSAPLLIDFDRGDRTVKGLVHPGRNGYLWFLERLQDRIGFVDAQPYVKQNVFLSLDPETGRPEIDELRKPGTGKHAEFCPSSWGGKDWPPAAFSPKTRLLYIPANDNICSSLKGEEVEYRPGQLYMGIDLSDEGELLLQEGAEHSMGEIQAWSVDESREVWTQTFEGHNWGPILVTAGNVLFAGGTSDRKFRAFDARTGELLWSQVTNSGVIGVPSSYAIDGVQYVAVLSGYGVDAALEQEMLNAQSAKPRIVPQGGVLWVFRLADAF
jgi:alcohol dehydrogenase (cytochrome c)